MSLDARRQSVADVLAVIFSSLRYDELLVAAGELDKEFRARAKAARKREAANPLSGKAA